MEPLLLSARGLIKSYDGAPALAGIDLDVRAGESIAIRGASGSGKTTLLHVLAGILSPDAGTVVLAGSPPVDVTALGDAGRSAVRRERFGFVFQDGLLIPELTAVENAALPLMLNGAPRADAERHAAAWLATLGLAGLEGRRIGQLSGGQAQRVAIARAQVTSPSIVFADEPTGALDSTTGAEVMSALLATAAGPDRALVVVTHDRQVAAACGRVIDVRDGRIVAAEGVGAERETAAEEGGAGRGTAVDGTGAQRGMAPDSAHSGTAPADGLRAGQGSLR